MTALTTIARVKSYLGISTTADDALLTDLLNGASLAIENYLNRTLSAASYTAVMDGNGSVLLPLPNYPVTAVSSLKIDGQVIPLSAAFGKSGYVNAVDRILLRSYVFSLDFQNVEISYTAGYSTIPDDIQTATVAMVALRYKEKDWVGYQSKSLAGETVAFQTSFMPDYVKQTLDAYVRVWPQ